jgi:hypothetical protein
VTASNKLHAGGANKGAGATAWSSKVLLSPTYGTTLIYCLARAQVKIEKNRRIISGGSRWRRVEGAAVEHRPVSLKSISKSLNLIGESLSPSSLDLS